MTGTELEWRVIRKCISESLCVPIGIRSLVENEIQNSYAVLERVMQLSVFGIIPVVSPSESNVFLLKEWFVDITLCCGTRNIFCGMKLFTEIN